MKMHQVRDSVAFSFFVILVGILTPMQLSAHCDTMDGPVVKAALRALESGRVEPVLAWVLPDDEQEVRRAFERTVRVRARGGEARELADLWFFETVVRLHRVGEGESYTGLKPAGTEIDPAIAAADRALQDGSWEALGLDLEHQLSSALRELFEEVEGLQVYDSRDVEAGRRYVHAYVRYMHFVEELHAMLSGGTAGHWSAHATEEPSGFDPRH